MFSKRSWIAIGPRLQKPVIGDCNNKGADSLCIRAVSSATLLSAFLDESYQEKFQFLATCVTCLAEGTGLKIALSETQNTGFLTSWPVLLAREL